MNIRALLELCRVSNLPTVWSNVLVGVTVGVWMIQPRTPTQHLPARFLEIATFFIPACVAMSLLYCAGMVMNDWVDRDIDANERPHRPIPSGRVKASHARAMGLILLAVGVLLVLLTQALLGPMRQEPPLEGAVAAGLLAATIIGYNLLHQQAWLSVWLMGMCRALVILTCLFIVATAEEFTDASQAWLWVAGPCVTLLLYTVLISIIARNEMQPRWFGGPKTVMNMIAAMPLIDAVWLVAIGLWPASLFCITCAGMTKLAHRKVAGS